MFEMANNIFMEILIVFQGYCLQYFYGNFMEGRIRDKRWNGSAVIAVYGVSRMALTWLVPSEMGDYMAAVWKLILSLAILLFSAICFYKSFHRITIFLVVAFQAVAEISRYTAVILLGELDGKLLDVWNWCAGKGLITSARAFRIAVNGGIIGGWFLEYLAMALLLYLSLKKMARDFGERDYDVSNGELMFILTPAAVGLMICMLLRIIIVTVEDSIPKVLYVKYHVLIIVIPAILLLSLLSILHGVKLFQDMICRNREKSSRIILEKQVRSLQEHMEEVERIYSGIGRMKHDMKNTISIIGQLFAGNGKEEHEQLQAYLSELDQTFQKLELRFKTGNTIVDTLLNMKYHEAVREVPGLEMDAAQLMFPKNLEIRGYDIGVILGNALDNAIEACRKLKAEEQEADTFIRLSSLQKGRFLILKVENSFSGKLARKRQHEFPATDKADKKSHGIGLVNIKKTAQNYQGTMDFKVEGRVFILSVMLKNERNY